MSAADQFHACVAILIVARALAVLRGKRVELADVADDLPPAQPDRPSGAEDR